MARRTSRRWVSRWGGGTAIGGGRRPETKSIGKGPRRPVGCGAPGAPLSHASRGCPPRAT
eukprot:13327537-Alexandrium_andersonii.AAC.1